jgi:hypothetical protein
MHRSGVILGGKGTQSTRKLTESGPGAYLHAHGPGAKAIDLPAAVAHRNLVDSQFLQESMTALPGAGAAFNRISYFDYNPVSGQYEYFSLDTRAPQMMNERSVRPAKPDEVIELYGGVFVATQWGSATNVPFRYRLNVGPIHGKHTDGGALPDSDGYRHRPGIPGVQVSLYPGLRRVTPVIRAARTRGSPGRDRRQNLYAAEAANIRPRSG